MTRDEILSAIARILSAHLDWQGTLEPRMRLIEDLALDSLRRLTLAVEVENLFRVKLEPEDEAGLETVGDLAALVEHKLAAKES